MRASLAVGLLVPLVLLAGCADSSEGGDGSGDGSDASLVAPEAGVVAGQLTAAEPTFTTDLPVDTAGHERLAVMLVMTTNLPATSVSMLINGPEGRTAGSGTGPLLYAFPGTRPTVSFQDPPVGGWTAEVELNGAAADFELHWCADSAAAPGPQANGACQRDFS